MDENTKMLLTNALNMRSAMMIPLVVANQWLGFVMSLSTKVITMNDTEIRQIISLTGQAATVAQSQRLYQSAQAQARHEQILREVSAKVSAAVDAESVLQTATREIGRVLGLETFIYLKDPKNRETAELSENEESAANEVVIK
jgi:GAF domain-containing protein